MVCESLFARRIGALTLGDGEEEAVVEARFEFSYRDRHCTGRGAHWLTRSMANAAGVFMGGGVWFVSR